MELFHIIDDAHIILRSRGVYKQSKLYRRGKDLFAASGGGFIRVMQAHGTSAPNISWVDLDIGVGVVSGLGGLRLEG